MANEAKDIPQVPRRHALVPAATASTDEQSPGVLVRTDEDTKAPVLKSDHEEAIVAAVEDSHSPATRTHYACAWRIFEAWCAEHGYASLPATPEVVAAYLTDRAESISMSGVKLDRAAIRHHHTSAGLDSPTTSPGVARVMSGLRRRAADSPPKQASGLTATDLAAIKATAFQRRSGPTGRTESEEAAQRRGAVDLALIQTMRDALLRGSEAIALTWADIRFEKDGSARLTIRRSKTDQEGSGAVQFLGPDAAEALRAIQTEDDDDSARVFGLSSIRTVSNRIRAACRAAGLRGRYSSHSCRIGMVRDLVQQGFSTTDLQIVGRWTSSRMPALYSREQAAARSAVARYYLRPEIAPSGPP